MTITLLAEHHFENSSGALYWTATNNTLSVVGQKFWETFSKVFCLQESTPDIYLHQFW